MFPKETRILIVDDMVAMRRIVRNQSRNLGFSDIQEAENGQKGYDILTQSAASGNPVQLVLSDWNMPVMMGIDLLRLVRSTEGMKQLPFLMITAEGQQTQILAAIQAGVSNYLVKPFTPAGMKLKVEAVWKKHNPAK